MNKCVCVHAYVQEMTLKEVIGSLIIKLIEETVVLEKDDDGDVMSNKSSSLSLVQTTIKITAKQSSWKVSKCIINFKIKISIHCLFRKWRRHWIQRAFGT